MVTIVSKTIITPQNVDINGYSSITFNNTGATNIYLDNYKLEPNTSLDLNLYNQDKFQGSIRVQSVTNEAFEVQFIGLLST